MRGVLLLTVLGAAGRLVRFSELSGGDPALPCPWCTALTAEDDESCSACGRRFG